MATAVNEPEIVTDELDLIGRLVPLEGLEIVEIGCGAAELSRRLLAAHPRCRVSALDVDERQLERNRRDPQAGLEFVMAGAEAMPFPDGRFALALMLKSLHHVPMALLDRALDEIRRVLRPAGWLYVSEPVYAGPLNEIVRLFNDEGEVRAAAQAALDRAIAAGGWEPVRDIRFQTPVRFRDFADFERRMIDVSFAERRLSDALRAQVRRSFEAQADAQGASFMRPMHARLLRSHASRG